MNGLGIRYGKRGVIVRGLVLVLTIAVLLVWLWWQRPRYPYQTVSVEGYEFRYIELLKGTNKKTATVPMLIALHGQGDNANDFAHVLDDIDFPVRIIVPEAFYGKKGWYAWENQLRGIPIEARKLQAFIIAVIKKYEPAGRPVVYGFSQGGNLVLYLALWDPVRFSYVVVEGSCVPEVLHPKIRRLDVAYPEISQHHGADDVICDMTQVQRQIQNITKLGIPITLKQWPTGHKCFYPDRMHTLFDELESACRAVQK
jgi:phospholipase/carboxylesterase